MKIEKRNHAVHPIMVPVKTNLKTINFFLYQSGNELTLIDAGLNNDECWHRLLETLETNGLALKDITQIFLTHHHIDHVGLVDRIISEHPIPVYAHPRSIPRLKRDRAFMERRVDFFETLYQEADTGEAGEHQIRYLQNALKKNESNGVQANIRPLEEADMDMEIIEVPGHAPDQVAFFHESTGRLFGGDLLIQHISSNALIEPDFDGNRQRSLLQHIDSMAAVRDLQPEVIFSGHGELINDASALVRYRFSEIEEKAGTLAQLIAKGHKTVDALARAFYEKRYASQFPLVISEIIGHLDYLEAEGHVEKEKVDGVWRYRLG